MANSLLFIYEHCVVIWIYCQLLIHSLPKGHCCHLSFWGWYLFRVICNACMQTCMEHKIQTQVYKQLWSQWLDCICNYADLCKRVWNMRTSALLRMLYFWSLWNGLPGPGTWHPAWWPEFLPRPDFRRKVPLSSSHRRYTPSSHMY